MPIPTYIIFSVILLSLIVDSRIWIFYTGNDNKPLFSCRSGQTELLRLTFFVAWSSVDTYIGTAGLLELFKPTYKCVLFLNSEEKYIAKPYEGNHRGICGQSRRFFAILLCFFLSTVINVLTLLSFFLLGLHSYPAKHGVYCRYRYITEHAVTQPLLNENIFILQQFSITSVMTDFSVWIQQCSWCLADVV